MKELEDKRSSRKRTLKILLVAGLSFLPHLGVRMLQFPEEEGLKALVSPINNDTEAMRQQAYLINSYTLCSWHRVRQSVESWVLPNG